MKIAAVIQARMGSTRLPGKVLLPIMGRPVLGYMVERVKQTPGLDDVIVATSVNPLDDEIEAFCQANEISVFRGSEEDVLGRIVGAIKEYQIEALVELFGDCPLIDPEILDRLLAIFLLGEYDCVFNALSASYPSGLEAKVLRASIYVDIEPEIATPRYRECPNLYLRDFVHLFRVANLKAPPELTRPETFLDLDTQEDFIVIRSIFEGLYPVNRYFRTKDVLEFLDAHPEVQGINRNVERRWKTAIQQGEQG